MSNLIKVLIRPPSVLSPELLSVLGPHNLYTNSDAPLQMKSLHCTVSGEERGENFCQGISLSFVYFVSEVLALSPGILAYKLAHNSYGQYCKTRISQPAHCSSQYFLFSSPLFHLIREFLSSLHLLSVISTAAMINDQV